MTLLACPWCGLVMRGMTHNFPLVYAVLERGEQAVDAMAAALGAAFGVAAASDAVLFGHRSYDTA